jgi:hypothetical protein
MFSSGLQLALAMATFILIFQLTFYKFNIFSRSTKNYLYEKVIVTQNVFMYLLRF